MALTCNESDIFHGRFFTGRSAGTMRALEELIIVGVDWDTGVSTGSVSRMKDVFEHFLGHNEGWVCPNIKFMGVAKGVEFGVEINDEDGF